MPVKAKKHTEHHLPTLAFIRAGNQIVNLAHVCHVDLPVEGDPTKPLTIHFAQGGNLNLTGDDAAQALDALGEICDCDPAKPEKVVAPRATSPAK